MSKVIRFPRNKLIDRRPTPLRRDLETRLRDIRANGPKNSYVGSLETQAATQRRFVEVGEILAFQRLGVPTKELAPTKSEVIAAGGYRVKP